MHRNCASGAIFVVVVVIVVLAVAAVAVGMLGCVSISCSKSRHFMSLERGQGRGERQH